MCCKKQFKYCPSEIDECMRTLVKTLDVYMSAEFEVISCCCGHGKYPMTILVRNNAFEVVTDICSGKVIPRKRNFYKLDKNGYYYIPECVKLK